jgi:hypothetical protein
MSCGNESKPMIDIAKIRQAIANLPRADNHRPGEPVSFADAYMASSHRPALDLDRPVVIGNRGMGKSFWAHALLNPQIRTQLARQFRFPALDVTQVVVGFNASERADGIAPPPAILGEAGQGRAAESPWRAILTRAAAQQLGESLPERFADLVDWVEADKERCARLLTRADDELRAQGRKLLVLFDALDRLGSDWTAVRTQMQGLLQLALATQSFRAIRVKLFLRRDQHSDPRLYEFPDGSKLRNTAVELAWDPLDLYQLLFLRLRANPAFRALEQEVGPHDPPALVEALAGQYMGSGRKRGYVVTWIPIHLADALRQISPRTFLTAWREAACHGPCPQNTPVDHQGILEGVRRASEDRLAELSQDYPWVRALLEPLRGQMVPMEHDRLMDLWRSSGAAAKALQQSLDADKPALVPRIEPKDAAETAFLKALEFIGVLEVRRNDKVDVPDIFRVEAGIKRRGGVKPPVRTRSAR